MSEDENVSVDETYLHTGPAEEYLRANGFEDITKPKIRTLCQRGELTSETLKNGRYIISMSSIRQYVAEQNNNEVPDGTKAPKKKFRQVLRAAEKYRRFISQKSRAFRIFLTWVPGAVMAILAWLLSTRLEDPINPLSILFIMSLGALAITHLLLVILDDLSGTSFKFEGFTASGSAAVFFAAIAFFNYQYWKQADLQGELVEAQSQIKDLNEENVEINGTVKTLLGSSSHHDRFLTSMPVMFDEAPLNMPMKLNFSVRCLGTHDPLHIRYEQTVIDDETNDPKIIPGKSGQQGITVVSMDDSTAKYIVKDPNTDNVIAGVSLNNTRLIYPSLVVDIDTNNSVCADIAAQKISVDELRAELGGLSVLQESDVIKYYRKLGDVKLRIEQADGSDHYRRLTDHLVTVATSNTSATGPVLELLAALEAGWETSDTVETIKAIMAIVGNENLPERVVDNSVIAFRHCPDADVNSDQVVSQSRLDCLIKLNNSLFSPQTQVEALFERARVRMKLATHDVDQSSEERLRTASADLDAALGIASADLKSNPKAKVQLLSDVIFAKAIALYLVGDIDKAREVVTEFSVQRTASETARVIDRSVDLEFLRDMLGDIGELRHGAKGLIAVVSEILENPSDSITSRMERVRLALEGHETLGFQMFLTGTYSDKTIATTEIENLISTFRDVYPELSEKFPYLSRRGVYESIETQDSQWLIVIYPEGDEALTLTNACAASASIQANTGEILDVRGPADWSCSV